MSNPSHWNPTMTSHTSPSHRELDHRVSDGIDVRLLWSPAEDTVLVTVSDEKSGEHFTLDIREPARALDAFRHPFAYADASHSEPKAAIPVTAS